MRSVVTLLLVLVAAKLAYAAPDTSGDIGERQRRLSLLFATESRSFLCDSPYRVRSAGEPGATLESARNVAFVPVSPGVEDLHNWVPMDETLRTRLRDVHFGEPATGETLCGGTLDTASRLYLPAKHQRGDVARLMLYLERRHDVTLDSAARQKFIDWDMADPVDSAEAARAWRIDFLQGTDFGVPRHTLDEIQRELRQRRVRDRPFDTGGILAQLRKHDYRYAYVQLSSELLRRLDALSLDLIDGKTGAWDHAFELLAVHDAAARVAPTRFWAGLDPVAAKMFAFAVAAGDDEMARWHADWLTQMVPPGMEYQDVAYPAFVVQLAAVVLDRRWPRPQDLRPELGPYRKLFLDAADARSWRDAVNTAVNGYLEPDLYHGPNPRLFPVEFAALVKLRRQYAPSQYSEPIHALQLLPSTQVPLKRAGSRTPALQVVLQKFLKAPELPTLHRAILANDRKAFDAALPGADLNQRDHLGQLAIVGIGCRACRRPRSVRSIDQPIQAVRHGDAPGGRGVCPQPAARSGPAFRRRGCPPGRLARRGK